MKPSAKQKRSGVVLAPELRAGGKGGKGERRCEMGDVDVGEEK